MKTINKLGLCFVVAAALVACGGGGGSSVPVLPFIPPVAITVPLVTSVPTATYAVGSDEKTAFDLLNAERFACGFGKLAQSPPLDVATKGHADWQLTNNYYGHYQIAGTPGFTGVTPADRIFAAGYDGSNAFGSTEVVSSGPFYKTGFGSPAISTLFNAPYHMLAMLRGFRDVGVAVRDTKDLGITGYVESRIVVDFGAKTALGMQIPGAGSVRTYPCEGSANVARYLYGETPNPVPGRDLWVNPLGRSIGVVIDANHAIKITGASLINKATGASAVLRPAVTAANDPNAIGGGYYLTPNEAFISADAPLAANTSYQATVNGTDDGVAFSRTFSFTTGLY